MAVSGRLLHERIKNGNGGQRFPCCPHHRTIALRRLFVALDPDYFLRTGEQTLLYCPVHSCSYARFEAPATLPDLVFRTQGDPAGRVLYDLCLFMDGLVARMRADMHKTRVRIRKRIRRR